MPLPYVLTNLIPRRISNQSAFTFIEIMVTITILSLGIILIFKALFFSLDQISYLTTRLYATITLDNRIAETEQTLRIYNSLPFDLNHTETVTIGQKQVTFKEQMNFGEVEDFADVFNFDLSFMWEEGQRQIHLSRSAYLLDYQHLKD